MALSRKLAVKYMQFHVGMLEVERNLQIGLDVLNKVKEYHTLIGKVTSTKYKEEIGTLSSKLSQLKANLTLKSKELEVKENALIKVREEPPKKVDKNEELKQEMKKKVDEGERKGRVEDQSEFLASDEYQTIVAKYQFKGASDFKKSLTYESNIVGRVGEFLM